MNNCKLVICDIDSTLIVKHQTLTPRAHKVIDTLLDKGIYFGIASGRPLYQIRDSIHSWGFEDFNIIIGMNGSSLWDSLQKKESEYYLMKKEWIKEIMDMMSQYECNPSIYLDHAQIFQKNDETAQLYASRSNLPVKIISDPKVFYQNETAKIMFRVEEEDMPKIEKWIQEHSELPYTGFKTQPDLIEFCDKRVNKAFALKKFCEMNRLSLQEVIAFGDTSNDNEMIEAAGFGVCMANGSEDTKMIADAITDKCCDDDGWADYMENHFLKYL